MKDKHQRRQKRRQQKQARAAELSSPLHVASALFQSGKAEQAGEILDKFLSDQPDNFEALTLLSVIHATLENPGAALPLFEHAAQISPGDANIQNNLAKLCQDQNRVDEAIGYYHRSLEIEPNNEACHINLGKLLQDKNDLTGAVACYKRALAINPANAGVHSNLGNALVKQGLFDDAVSSHKRALEIDPGGALLHSNLGIALKAQGLLDDAVVSHIRALEIDPRIASIHNNLGYALEEQGYLNDAIASFKKALTINPDYADAHNNLGSALHSLGKSEEAAASYHKALAINPNFVRAQSNLIFSLNYIADHPLINLLSEARRFGDMVTANVTPESEHSNSPDPNRRLRVGLVSGDFRHHSVSSFLETILSEIDTKNLQLFAYATSGTEDDMTVRLKSIVTDWRKATFLSDRQLANAILADEIDILIDLSGHTSHHRLRVFSMKPAPIQITWLGYGGTTGVEAMDYILCDPLILPPSDEAQYTEKPWRLPDIWVCFSPPSLDIDVGALPALTNGHLTFGSLNNLTKLSDQTVACWAKVLEAVPDSRLLLKAKQLDNPMVQEETFARFEVHGIDRQRLTLKSKSSEKAEHLHTYNEMDIALDPFPYAGVTTSIEALWMGTPVLALKGDRFVSHMGESLLHNMGLEAWIADTPEDYVKKIKDFASDPQDLSFLQKNLRNRLLGSPICDAPRFAGNLEAAFREMWRKWCATKEDGTFFSESAGLSHPENWSEGES